MLSTTIMIKHKNSSQFSHHITELATLRRMKLKSGVTLELSKEMVVELMKVLFPKPEEELVDFLNRCELSNSRSMLCPNCNVIYDEEAAKNIEALKKKHHQGKIQKWCSTMLRGQTMFKCLKRNPSFHI